MHVQIIFSEQTKTSYVYFAETTRLFKLSLKVLSFSHYCQRAARISKVAGAVFRTNIEGNVRVHLHNYLLAESPWRPFACRFITRLLSPLFFSFIPKLLFKASLASLLLAGFRLPSPLYPPSSSAADCRHPLFLSVSAPFCPHLLLSFPFSAPIVPENSKSGSNYSKFHQAWLRT